MKGMLRNWLGYYFDKYIHYKDEEDYIGSEVIEPYGKCKLLGFLYSINPVRLMHVYYKPFYGFLLGLYNTGLLSDRIYDMLSKKLRNIFKKPRWERIVDRKF